MDAERLARVEEKVQGIREDVHEMKKDVKALLEFKWRIYGVTALIAFVITIVAEGLARGLN
jgi:hypothetical protein